MDNKPKLQEILDIVKDLQLRTEENSNQIKNLQRDMDEVKGKVDLQNKDREILEDHQTSIASLKQMQENLRQYLDNKLNDMTADIKQVSFRVEDQVKTALSSKVKVVKRKSLIKRLLRKE